MTIRGSRLLKFSDTLLDIGDLTPTDSNFIVGNGATWVAESGDTARTSMGVGPNDTLKIKRLLVGGVEG